MLNSTVLEVAIGLVFCFASVALITSSINEALASWLGLRAQTLRAQLQRLLNADTKQGEQLLLHIYNHALVHPLGSGSAPSLAKLDRLPSYIEPRNFAVALVDAIRAAQGNAPHLSAGIDAIDNAQLRQLLRGLYEQASGDVPQLQAALAAWFDAAMDRASGAYKRKSQLWCFGIALALAVLFNIDSVHLFTTLWKHPALVAQISAPAAAAPTGSTVKALQDLQTLPIGWQTTPRGGDPSNSRASVYELLSRLVGWLITATAALFGAPFWFDLLQQLVRLRGTGPKPKPLEDKKPDAGPPAHVPLPVLPASERNAIVDLHAQRNQDDPSYRPLQAGEKW